MVDLGTEFVSRQVAPAALKFEVFKGSVVAEMKPPMLRTQKKYSLKAGRAIRLEGTEAAPGTYDRPERFVWCLPDRSQRGPIGQSLRPGSVGPSANRAGSPRNCDRRRPIGLGPHRYVSCGCEPPYGENYYVEGGMMYDAQFLYIGPTSAIRPMLECSRSTE